MSEKPRILAIDDDLTWLSQVPDILEDDGAVDTAASIDDGLSLIDRNFYDIVLLDLNFEGDQRNGLDVFRMVSAQDSGVDVIVISGETRPEVLIETMNAGPAQFIRKPASPDQIRMAVREILKRREVRLRVINQAATNSSKEKAVALIGSSHEMQRLREEIRQAVENGVKDILLTGATGTGKEVVAKTIAQMADPSQRMVPVHCAAISDGLAESELFGHVKGAFTGALKDRAGAFEVVGGGYVFLDEVGDMPLNHQAKLLRVIQERKVTRVGSNSERPVTFRTISATNVDLKKAIAEGKFREDLFYRLAKVVIRIPSLRERASDIPELVNFFLAQRSSERPVTITSQAMDLLCSYDWPGNVRQLESAIEVMAIKCSGGVIRDRDVCKVIPEIGIMFFKPVRSFLGQKGASLVSQERKKYEGALLQARGDREAAARILQVSRATFFRRAKELGVISGRKH